MPVNPSDIMSSAAARIQRTEAYAEQVRKMFAKTVNEILALNKTMPTLEEGVMFSFDGESIKKQKEVERLLRQLHSAATAAIKNGIELEWEQANTECDKLISSAFGKAVLSSTMFSAWTQRNESAMQAFINRSESGLNLSDRVWQSVRQLRDEMEVAMTVGIGEGQSAASMSRKVRQYLNDPDLMFRRFRYKDESGEWRLKWKKRIKDEKTGKYKWIDYDKSIYQDDWTGKGYYKSAAQNAMRVTRTETNMAYRRADNERWAQMDFVLGQRINLSRSHPRKDICDKLQGDYPKEFVFDGWHPQCFCFVTPILVDEDEMAKSAQAFLKGEKYVPQGKQITEYPEAFKDWVKGHEADIQKARERGTEPYFIKNNKGIIDNILNPKPKELTTLEKAALRHEARTPEQIADIKSRWEQREKKYALIKKTADNVLKVAQDYGEVDYAKLQQYISEGNLSAMQTEAKAVAHSVSAMKKQEAALSSLIPDAHGWHKQFTMSELQGVYNAVESKLQKWASLSLEQQAKKLEFEIKYVADPIKYKAGAIKYSTWEVSQSAYTKQLASVNYKIATQEIQKELATVSAWSKQHTQSKKVAALLADAENAIANGEDIAAIKQKAALATAEYQKRLAEQARRNRKNGSTAIFDADAYSQARKDAAVWDKGSGKKADGALIDTAGNAWQKATSQEKKYVYEYTSHYCDVNEPLQGRRYSNHQTRARFEEKVKAITSYIENNELPCDIWFTRGDNGLAVIENRIKFAGGTMPKNLQDLVGMEMQEGGFMSMGSRKGKGFSSRQVIMNIYCPKGTKAAYIEPISAYGNGDGISWDGKRRFNSFSSEHETLCQRGTRMRITKVYQEGSKIYIDCEVILQEIKDLSYVLDRNIGY